MESILSHPWSSLTPTTTLWVRNDHSHSTDGKWRLISTISQRYRKFLVQRPSSPLNIASPPPWPGPSGCAHFSGVHCPQNWSLPRLGGSRWCPHRGQKGLSMGTQGTEHSGLFGPRPPGHQHLEARCGLWPSLLLAHCCRNLACWTALGTWGASRQCPPALSSWIPLWAWWPYDPWQRFQLLFTYACIQQRRNFK